MTQTNTDKTLSTERRKDIADALEDMAETLGLAKGHRSILQSASAALRAASITPPAPERSKEEVGVKPLEWHERVTGVHRAETIVGDYRVWTHHEADGVVFWQLSDGGIKAAGQGTEAGCFAAAHADYEQRIKSALEPASLHKGEAVAKLTVQVMDGGAASASVALVSGPALYHLPDGEYPLYASPHPVTISPEEGVRVTDEMVVAVMHKADDLDMCMTDDDARELLTAALSVKPGERG